jgi:hypothetical protein
VRKEFGLCLGVVILGCCFHLWVDSSLTPRMAESLTPTQAANLGGLVAGAATVVVGVTFGWLAGRWLIVFQYPIESTDVSVENHKPTFLRRLQHWFESYPLSRGLLLGGAAVVAGAALGFWWLLASLVMVLAFSLGYWGRVMALGY